jgi:hypothetical protein
MIGRRTLADASVLKAFVGDGVFSPRPCRWLDSPPSPCGSEPLMVAVDSDYMAYKFK